MTELILVRVPVTTNVTTSRGPRGATGPAGPTGPTGPTGATGPEGPAGAEFVPPGADTEVLFKDGAVAGAHSGLTYNKTTGLLQSNVEISSSAFDFSAGTALSLDSGFSQADDLPCTTSVLIVDLYTDGILSSLLAPTTDGRVLHIVVRAVSGSRTLTLLHDSASGTVGNRLLLADGADIVLGPVTDTHPASIALIYNLTIGAWVPLSSLRGPPGPTGPQGADGTIGVDGATGPTGPTGPAGSSLTRPAATLTSSSGVVTVDLSQTTEVYTLTLTENVTSWVFNNPPASGYVAEIRIDVVQHASSAKTCVSPATAGTAGGAWTVTTALGATESLGLVITHAGAVALYPSGVLA